MCNLAWSKHSSELVSTHGYSQNQILVWKYPSLTQVAKLTGHSYRVLYLALSPDGEAIVTGAGDETLRFWNVFSKTTSHRENKSVLSLYTAVRWKPRDREQYAHFASVLLESCQNSEECAHIAWHPQNELSVNICQFFYYAVQWWANFSFRETFAHIVRMVRSKLTLR